MTKVRCGISAAIAVCVAGMLQACGGVDIEQAKQLANAGVASSTKLQAEAQGVATNAASWREGRVFYATLVQGDSKVVLESDGSEITRLAKLLKARANALGALAAAYKSFQELAVYDAAQTTEAATASFLAETNEFLKTAQGLEGAAGAAAQGIAPLDPQVAAGISVGFGVIAREVQRAKIARTSVAIRTGVEKLSEVLKAERAYAVAARIKIAKDRFALRRMARLRGLGSYEQSAKALLAGFDIDPVKDLDAAILRSPEVTAAMTRVLGDRFNAEVESIGPTYDTLLKLLDALVEQHRQLEAGRQVSLASIISLGEELQGYYQRVHGAGSKPAGS